MVVLGETRFGCFTFDELAHNLEELRPAFETEVFALGHDLLALFVVDLDGACDDCLDELDFVEEDLIFLLQFAEHVLFPYSIQLLTILKELFQNVSFSRISANLPIPREQHQVANADCRLQLECFQECCVTQTSEFWHFQHKMHSVFLVILRDVGDEIIFLRHLLKLIFVVASPSANRQLSDFEFSL